MIDKYANNTTQFLTNLKDNLGIGLLDTVHRIYLGDNDILGRHYSHGYKNYIDLRRQEYTIDTCNLNNLLSSYVKLYKNMILGCLTYGVITLFNALLCNSLNNNIFHIVIASGVINLVMQNILMFNIHTTNCLYVVLLE